MAIGPSISATGSYFAAEKSADATRDATNASIDQQNRALQQQAELSAPYRKLGTDAMPLYEQLLGIGGNGTLDPNTISAALEKMPGYEFTKDQGTKSILNQTSLAGGVSGNTLAALDEFNTGLAQKTYGSTVDNIRSAVGLGQAAAAGQAANVGQSASNISNALIKQGDTMAGIDANLAAGLAAAGNQASSNANSDFFTIASLFAA